MQKNSINCNNSNTDISKKNIESNNLKKYKINSNNIQLGGFTNNNINSINSNYQEINIIKINNFKKKEIMLYDVIKEFYKKCSEEEIIKIINIIEGKYKISLRFLDWFVTRYCYLYKTSIKINNNYNKELDFNINISYKAQLKSFKKNYFDPFRRKNKFEHLFDNYPNYSILTTLGQLNFLKWVLSFDIIKYVENNFDDINKKINHVNSFFKKNIIDNNSLSISSEEPTTNLSQKDIDLLMGSDFTKDLNNIEKNLEILNIDKKLYTGKKIMCNYYNPIISRNICVEL